MEVGNLVRIKTYADTIGKSVTWVYKLAYNNKLEIKQIDKVNFVDLSTVK